MTELESAFLTWQASVLASYTTPACGTNGVPGSISPYFIMLFCGYSAMTDAGFEPTFQE